MPRSHKPRKRYVPKRIDHDPVDLAMSGAALLQPHQRGQLLHPALLAFQALRTGQGTEQAWRQMADAANLAEALAERGIANDHEAKFEAAQITLADLHARVRTTGRWTLRGPEITALQDALEIYEIQLERASQREVDNAISTVRQRIGQALAGNAPRDAVVCTGGLGAGQLHQPRPCRINDWRYP